MESKRFIKLTFKYWEYLIDNNLCTMEEIDALSRMMQKDIAALGTVEDFARFCDKPEQYVRNVINQKVVDKPKRRVYYHLVPFLKNIPSKWLKDR